MKRSFPAGRNFLKNRDAGIRSANGISGKCSICGSPSEAGPCAAGARTRSTSAGWNETTDRKRNIFEVNIGVPSSWSKVILQGPHISVCSPLIKIPRPVVNSNNDWIETDYESMPDDYLPRVIYQLEVDQAEVAKALFQAQRPRKSSCGHHGLPARVEGNGGAEQHAYLHAAIIPPGATHVHGVSSLGSSAPWPSPGIAVQAALFASIPLDFLAKTAGGSALAKYSWGNYRQ